MKYKVGLLFLFLFSVIQSVAQINYKHFVTAGRINLSEEKYVEAIRNFTTAIVSKPDHFEAYFLRGIAKYSLNDFKGSADDFSKTLAIHPLYTRALHYRGLVYDRMTNYYDALSDFSRAIEIDPYHADLYVASGATKMHMNDFEGAIADYDQALLIASDNSLAYLNRGIAKRFLEQLDDALDDMNKAVYYDFFSIDARLRRGMVQLELENFEDAMTDFNQAIKMDATNPLSYFQRGITYLHLNDTTAALKDFEHVNQLDQRNALTYYNRALLYAKQKEYDKALEMFELVTLINPQNIYGYFNRGVLYCQMEEWNEAEADFTKTLTLFPDFGPAWVNRSLVRREKKDEKGSYADYLKAMDIIATLNNESGDVDSLYALYADPKFFDDIIAFESDFINGEAKQNRVQFSMIEIKTFDNFYLDFVSDDLPKNTDSRKEYYSDIVLSQLNEQNLFPEKLVIKLATSQSEKASENTALQLENLNDPYLKVLLEGMQQYEKANFQKAEDAFRSILEHPDYGEYALLNLSVLLTDKAELTLAEQQYDNAIVITRKKAIDKPLTNLESPDYTSTLAVLWQLTAKNKKNAFAWYNVGNTLLRMKEYSRAIDCYTEALNNDPNLAEAYYNRALTLIFLSENKLACNDLSRAGELGIQEAYPVIKKYCN